MKAISFFLWIVFALMCQSAAAESGEVLGHVDCRTFKGTGCLLSGLALKGTIDDAMNEKLVRLFEDFQQQAHDQKVPNDPSHTKIKLNSLGGSVSAAMKIGRLLRKYRMTAVVGDGSICDSACVLIYAGAVARFRDINTGGAIGIHQPFFTVPDAPIDAEVVKKNYTNMLQEIKSYLREMNVSERLADEMLKTPANTVHYLTNKEQDRLGLVVFDPVESEIQNLEQAKELGLDRNEFNRRQALIVKSCRLDANYRSCNETIFKTGKAPDPRDFSEFGTPAE